MRAQRGSRMGGVAWWSRGGGGCDSGGPRWPPSGIVDRGPARVNTKTARPKDAMAGKNGKQRANVPAVCVYVLVELHQHRLPVTAQRKQVFGLGKSRGPNRIIVHPGTSRVVFAQLAARFRACVLVDY